MLFALLLGEGQDLRRAHGREPRPGIVGVCSPKFGGDGFPQGILTLREGANSVHCYKEGSL